MDCETSQEFDISVEAIVEEPPKRKSHPKTHTKSKSSIVIGAQELLNKP